MMQVSPMSQMTP
ncbi:Protein of unknown function [Propionibacterium freudenreichii]|nr:Protein of unknown function [Propionibacterium freudenreichii subsp. freudenreichii]CEG86362.1 Protein of unknown function [Propionibacterium freudenreichii]CEG91412.1 Protein of unknown function [Propionibacterium freudenreichii]CEG96113.1 Protein of unknown function [Propionibacterium freudenreichii]CEG97158.1 Protein of unknown function [Propionibacterium freudenreichii]